MKLPRILACIAVLAAAGLLIACGDDDEEDGGDAATTPARSPGGGGDGEVNLELTAEGTLFDKDKLEAPAGANVSLTFDHRDDGTQHNFSLYESEDSDDPLFEGELITGPETRTYDFTAPAEPGTYHFHCDVHPGQMNGDFIVE